MREWQRQSLVISAVLLRIYSFKITKTVGSKKLLLHLFAALVMAVSLFGITKILPIKLLFAVLPLTVFFTTIFYLVLMALLGLAIYFLVLVALREFGKEDIRFFRNMFSPREMKKYISVELIQGKEN